DEENKSVRFKVTEGDIVDAYKTFAVTIRVDTHEEENVVTWTLDYEKVNEYISNPDRLMELALNGWQKNPSPTGYIRDTSVDDNNNNNDNNDDDVSASEYEVSLKKKHNLNYKSVLTRRKLWRKVVSASTKVRGILLLNVITLLYASNIPVLKEVEMVVDPSAFSAVRFTIAAIPFLPYAWKAREDGQALNSGLELGLWASLGYLMQAFGLLTSDAGRASVITMFTVIVVPLIDGMLGAAIPASTWFGAMMSIVGVGMMECSGSPPCMTLSGTIVKQVTIKSDGDVFHEIFRYRTHHMSEMSPGNIKGVDLHDGEWVTVGSIIVWDFFLDGKTKVVKEVIQAIDKEKKSVCFKVIEGDILEAYKTFLITLHVDTHGDENVVTWTFHFEKLNENVDDPDSLMELCINGHPLRPSYRNARSVDNKFQILETSANADGCACKYEQISKRRMNLNYTFLLTRLAFWPKSSKVRGILLLNVGDLFNFLSALFFGIHMLRTEHISRKTDKTNFLPVVGYEVFVIALSSIIWYLIGGAIGSSIENHPSSWTWEMFLHWLVEFPWIPALYTGVFSTGLCLYIEMTSMRDVSATETAIVYGLEPVWGAGFAWFFLGERWGVSGWFGAALVLGGSLMVQIIGASSRSSSVTFCSTK
ncbi:hypothetical protein M8C21_025112, partial [Ambrosia artemisiifolia]